MDIISIEFAGLTIGSALIYYLLNDRFKNIYLAILSCAFIAMFNLLLLPYVLAYAVFNYFIGLKLPVAKNKLLLYRLAIAINLGQLILLKYASFSIDPLFSLININFNLSVLSRIIVPIGISYFTLQGIGYVMNINKGWEQPEKNFPDFLLYIIFFPKFLSGPIERSNHFLPQVKEARPFNGNDITTGLRIALFGFFKKIAIADQIGPFVSNTFSDIPNVDGTTLIILMLVLPLYLYFDFSGYTDIAIGFARIFGIRLLPNFNRPFFSENMTTFWKRFHISLSSWFGDYVFRQIILKRRRWGVYASMYGVFITWTLFGIWHGAGWNFMLLGFLQALAINYEFFTRKWRYNFFKPWPVFLKSWFSRIITYMFYAVSLVFFFSPDLPVTLSFFSELGNLGGLDGFMLLRAIPLSALILIIIFLVYEFIQEDLPNIYERLMRFWWSERTYVRYLRWTLYSLVIAIIFVLGNREQQFIYVQF